MTHRGPQDSMRVYIAVKTPEERWAQTVGLAGQSPIMAKGLLLGDKTLFKDWAPELQELIAIGCDEDAKDAYNAAVDVKPIYTLPCSELWPAQPGVTIIGDAAHLMAPNGEGVNNAMADALDLANLLASIGPVDNAAQWQAAMAPKLREYEETMHRRACQAYEETDELLNIMHGSEEGGEALAAMFKSFMGGPEDGQKVVEMTKD